MCCKKKLQSALVVTQCCLAGSLCSRSELLQQPPVPQRALLALPQLGLLQRPHAHGHLALLSYLLLLTPFVPVLLLVSQLLLACLPRLLFAATPPLPYAGCLGGGARCCPDLR